MTLYRWVGAAIACGALAVSSTEIAQAQASTHKTKNVIVVMLDGMRWEEVFRGADPELIKTLGPEALGAPKERAAEAEQRYWRTTATERRAALMPFLWSTVATQGQLFGNRDLGSDSHVANPLHFSYPGYSETLTGLVDPRVNSNDNVPNPNVTVFEWLNKKPAFAGQVAAFGAWEVFDGIFNKQRCGFEVNSSYAPLTDIPATPELKLINDLKAETVRVWPDEAFDPMPFHTAVAYIKAKKPRLIFLGLGETDDWAHAGSYAEYLNAAHLGDGYLQALWTMIQAMPEYAGKTTLIVLPDHGRGVGAKWTDHGEKIYESRETWMAFLGPDTTALGERKKSGPVTESQVAATIAALLGEDYHGAVAATGAPLADVLPGKK
ncbi:MAG TPA: hypothetical protein VK716_02115 [Terracidiphilus sp.]|jgi:hypothetical protein|nr:hypothetical protein [Terracidiphilus sp.]